MNWLNQLIEKICSKKGLFQKNGSLRISDYSISIKDESDLFSVRVTDLFSISPPKTSDLLYHDEVEDYLLKTIDSL